MSVIDLTINRVRPRDSELTPEQLAKRLKNRAYYKQYMAKNRDRVNAKHREKYKQNKERYLGYVREWKERNPEYHKLHQREYREEKPDAPNGNVTRTKKMWTAQNKAILETKLAPFCELCPEDDVKPAKMRHHPDYNYPLIFVSVCQSCHSNIHADLKRAKKLEVVIVK